MNRRNALKFLAILISGVSAWNASANGFRLADQDAFATARGEAFVATADNASAIYYNPAGIARLEGENFRLGTYGIYYDPTYTPPPKATNVNHQVYHNWDRHAYVPQFFWTSTLKDWPLSFGIGVYSPYGMSVSWPQDTGFRSIATVASLNYATVNPVIAVRLGPHFSLGGGATMSYGRIDLQQGVTASTNPVSKNLFRFKGDGFGLGYNLGLLWQPDETVSIGASFVSSTKITMDGTTEWENLPGTKPTWLSARADFTFPLHAVYGVSCRPTPKWNFEFDVDYTLWSSLNQITIHQSNRVLGLAATNVNYTLNWQPSWMCELGVTRYFGNGLHVSAGYVYNQNSVPDDHYTPLVADLDRHFFSGGVGFKGKRFNFDVAYQFGYAPSRTVTGSTPPLSGLIAGQSADGKYGFTSHAVMLTVGMHY